MNRAIVRLREWARLQYPSIAKLYDIASEQDRMLIVTGRHEGESLQSRLEELGSEGRLEPEQLRDLVIHLGEALGYAHSHQVVHGELCPSQVILKTRGRVKLLRASPEVLDVWSGASLSPMFLPTVAYYQSPNQMVGIKATFKDDIYAFGVLLYRLCVGSYPFDGENFPALIQQILTHQLPDFEVSGEYPGATRDTILRCLERDPEKRFDSVLEVVTSLYPDEQFRSLNVTRVKELDGAALAYLKLMKYQKAYELWREALEIEPQNPFLQNNLGVALCRLDQYEEAKEVFHQAVQLAPHMGRIRYHLACTIALTGHALFAEIELANAVRIDSRLNDECSALKQALSNGQPLDERFQPRHMWAYDDHDPQFGGGTYDDDDFDTDDGAGVPRRPSPRGPSESAAKQLPWN